MIFLYYWTKYEYCFEKINFLFNIVLRVLMNLKVISFMSENLKTSNIENNEFNLNAEDSDYKNLIIKLREIKTTISLLEKIIFR